MARPREPLDLLLYKGKKNLTKQEIEERREQEIKAPNDKVKAPSYLPKDLKREFKKIADELKNIGIMTNLDVDALARFLFARKQYLEMTEVLLETPITALVEDDDGNKFEVANKTYSDLLINQDKLFKQCRQASSDLGLTISSRCKLVIPKKDDGKPKSKEEERFGGRM
ncbi:MULTISPECIES: phage terminase small subunit P27 family [Bacillus amyloliquefaciens group]|uniref:phage terminase small subunit P27 family n=1 Tax=Bacillus amyloliquefaciens group TaxID=1938374 RepID=UPI0013625E45|nr:MULTISPECIES: phage terminase small subunit P27 family [Bacillus amyloliquefaciens group]MBO3652046.1 phage terminase small subunit P27 family [Bacillus amyloliquefaciens]MCJ2174093.1 phage terminase small subunit P27 family [Bacillus amyloliquefaciens]MCR4351915.1 phage terminase small subunit P27 family [Bacillus amyloliquefaciens]MCR4356856.1 phage terminase small subunit P27 family [Bacillus amyloliquefaciens]MDX7984833.1 phage terminase small subunit P27 family [Bacillus velezensis]